MTLLVVLPTYNGSRYLAGAVAAIRAQTFTDWELVIIDDCSKDSTPGLIADLARCPEARSMVRSLGLSPSVPGTHRGGT